MGDNRTDNRPTRRIPRALAGTLIVFCGLAATAGCLGSLGDAGDTQPRNGPVPATPTPVRGAAIRGTVRDTHGHPGAGATVTVTTVLRTSERLWRDAKAWTTLGLGCLDTQGCNAPSAQAIVAANGRFAVPVPHGITRHDALAVSVEATRGPDARVETQLILPATATTGQTIDSIPLAASAPTFNQRANRDTLLPPAMPTATTSATVTMNQPATLDDPPESPTESLDVSHGFDPRLLEDGQARLVSTQTGTLAGLPVRYTTSLTVTGHHIPASRGAACVIEGSAGQALPQHPCALTNGDLGQAWRPHDDPACANGPCPGPAQADHRDVTVILAHPVTATLLVVRGCGFTCQIQLSADGHTFTPAGGPAQDTASTLYARALPALRVTAIRVQTATGGFFDSLQQVSLFS